MRRLFPCTFIASATALLWSSGAWATDFYACDCLDEADTACVAGSDANDGTAPDKAWRTYDKVQDEFGGLSAGDSILLCDGGAFLVENGSRFVNAQCTATSRCTVGSYQPTWAGASTPRPIVWDNGAGHAFALEDGGDPDHDEGYVFRNLDLRCTIGETQAVWGFFLYNDVDDVLIENVSMDGFAIGIHAAGSNACPTSSPGCDRLNERLVVRSCTFVNNHAQGFLGVSDDGLIEESYFENNGTSVNLDHNIYLGGESKGMTVRGNELYRSSVRAHGSCSAVSLVAHGNHEALTIEYNLVREDIGQADNGCWGIAVDGGYSEAESFTNVVIRGNTVVNVGNVSIGTSSCVDCIIEDNVIINEQAFGGIGIAAPDRDRGDSDAVETGVIVRNNSIYMTQSGTGITVGTEGANHQVVSNAIHYAGTGSFSCLDLGLETTAYDTVDYNDCYFPGAASGAWESGSPTTPDPLAGWQTASGFDTHSLLEDPGFQAPAAPDHDLSAASSQAAMVNAGHPSLSSPVDLQGHARDTQPDIGASEFGATLPPDGGTGGALGDGSVGGSAGSGGSSPDGSAGGLQDGGAGSGGAGTNASPPGDDGGCGCAMVGDTHGGLMGLAWIALGLLVRRRRGCRTCWGADRVVDERPTPRLEDTP